MVPQVYHSYYSCDCCLREIYQFEKRVKCLECCNVDLCICCYENKREINTHKCYHRMLIIPPVCEFKDVDDIPEAYLADTDNDELESLSVSQLESFYPLRIQDVLLDDRENVSVIDESLSLEIVDAMCYYQFDIEGIQNVLSKRVPKEQIENFINNELLSEHTTPMPSSHKIKEATSYSWDITLDKKEPLEEVTKESFSPTVIEHMMKHITLESCNPDLMLCLKEVEPLLHNQHHSLIQPTQVLSLLAYTMNTKRMIPIRDCLLQKQRLLSYVELCTGQLYPNASFVTDYDAQGKKLLVKHLARRVYFNLPVKSEKQKQRIYMRTKKNRKR